MAISGQARCITAEMFEHRVEHDNAEASAGRTYTTWVTAAWINSLYMVVQK